MPLLNSTIQRLNEITTTIENKNKYEALLEYMDTISYSETHKPPYQPYIDKLSYYAQTALRCIMEKYCKTCKFILTSHQLSKIISPLNLSAILTAKVVFPEAVGPKITNNLSIIYPLINFSLVF